MQSKWFELKGRAIRLRKKGCSIRDIEKRLGVPKSTLSGWLKFIQMDEANRKKLLDNWHLALAKARDKAALWHRAQKEKRLEDAKQYALERVSQFGLQNRKVQELALAVLYMGEGRKTQEHTSLGSSDPLIVRFFLLTLRELYNIDVTRVRCVLFLRADQNEEQMKEFWAKELHLPLHQFVRVHKDKRTLGSKTYEHYRGVCSVEYGDAAIQRRLVFMGRLILNNISQALLGT